MLQAPSVLEKPAWLFTCREEAILRNLSTTDKVKMQFRTVQNRF